MERLHLSGATGYAFSVVDAANEMIAKERAVEARQGRPTMRGLDAVLWNASEALSIAAVLLSPVHAGLLPPRSCAGSGVDADVTALNFAS